MRCDSTLKNPDLRFKIINLYGFQWILPWALIFLLLIVHRSRTLQACAAASADTTWEFPNTEAFLSATLLFIPAAHLWTALGVDILLPGELGDRDAPESTREVSCIDCLIGENSCIHWFVLNNHLLLLLVVIETFWKGWTLVSAINLICSHFKRFKILRRTHNPTIIGRNSANWVHIAKLLGFPWVSRFMHMRLRVWLRWLAALPLDCSEISPCTIFQANYSSIHLILMRTLFLQTNFRNNNSIPRCDSAGPFRLKSPYSSWVGPRRYRVLPTTSSSHDWLHLGARYPPPVSRMTRTHYDMLCIALLC